MSVWPTCDYWSLFKILNEVQIWGQQWRPWKTSLSLWLRASVPAWAGMDFLTGAVCAVVKWWNAPIFLVLWNKQSDTHTCSTVIDTACTNTKTGTAVWTNSVLHPSQITIVIVQYRTTPTPLLWQWRFRDRLPLEKQLSHQTTDWPPSSQFQSLNSKAGIYYTSGDGSSCLKNINEDVGLGTLCKTVVSKQFITAFTNASLDLTMWSTYISNIQKHRGLLCRAEI